MDSEPMPGRTPQESIDIVGSIATPKVEPTPDIGQLKKELDPRTISKILDQEGRNKTARAILEARTSARTTKENIVGNEQKVQEIAELTSSSHKQERQKMGELTQRLETLVVKLKSAVGLGDKQADTLQNEIGAIKSERENLFGQSFAIEDELKALKEKQAEIPSPKQLLEAYYEKVATQPLSNEQKRELLKPEVLSSLSTEEYIALWRRLNPYFLSHVTRQGFRDHYDMIYHSVGFEEFHNGFLDVMGDERLLRPSMALGGLIQLDSGWVIWYCKQRMKHRQGKN